MSTELNNFRCPYCESDKGIKEFCSECDTLICIECAIDGRCEMCNAIKEVEKE